MNNKTLQRRGLVLLALILLIAVLHSALNQHTIFMQWYVADIFPWTQQLRSNALNRFSISIGDYIYLLLGLFLLLLVLRLIYFSFRYKSNKTDFWSELLLVLNFPAFIYLLFLMLWGGNYTRPALANNWGLDRPGWDSVKLMQLNKSLVKKLNDLRATPIPVADFKLLNYQANIYYQEKLGTKDINFKVKHTSLGYLLNYLGINGYYNPISGEAQFNRFIPKFMHPFVIAHEMAHQTGIAAEDDANLLAYIICAESQDPSFRYSGYFNLFLYAFNDLKSINEQEAESLLQGLNARSKQDLRELREMKQKFKSRFRGISLYLYDEYLRWHGQKEGIDSYAGVVKWAYYWEQGRQQPAVNSSLNLWND